MDKMDINPFNGGMEMWVFVQDFHLLAPVKLVPPVGHHLLQVVRVEAIVEGCPFQWRRIASLVEAAVQVLNFFIRCFNLEGADAFIFFPF